MARRTDVVIIEVPGRDKGKIFEITEMSSDKGERWAIRALLAITNTGVKLPEGAVSAGMAGVAALGLDALIGALGKLDFNTVEPLLAEMWDCVKFKPSENVAARPVLQGDCGDIEEISTRIKLRADCFKLHINFSQAV